MSREQARQFLVTIGIENPSEEQITNYLNSVNGEVQKEKDNSKKYKEDAEKLAGLQKELDDLKSANLSDVEKATKSLEEANKKIAELERKDSIRQQRTNAMDKFKVTAEQAEKIIKDDGSFDMAVLGEIISQKETASATAKEQEIAKGAINPGGGNAGNKENEKPADVLNAESITFGEVGKDAQSARDYYK